MLQQNYLTMKLIQTWTESVLKSSGCTLSVKWTTKRHSFSVIVSRDRDKHKIIKNASISKFFKQ